MLDKCVASVLSGRRERRKAEEDWTRKLATTCATYEAKIKVKTLIFNVAFVDTKCVASQ